MRSMGKPIINQYIESELSVLKQISKKWDCEYVYVGSDVMSRVDAFLVRDNNLKAILEVKCRKQSYSWFKDYNSCMVSYAKIQIASDLSRLLKVKFFVLIQTGDGALIVFQITDEAGKIICPMNIRFTNGEKNNNFDKKQNTNAYLTIESNPFCKIIQKYE